MMQWSRKMGLGTQLQRCWCSCLLVENLVGLLEGLDLLLATSNALFVADMHLEADWLQVLLVGQSLVQLCLRGCKVLGCLTVLELCLVLLQARLHLQLVLRLLGCSGILHEGIILGGSSLLRSCSISMKTRKVARNDFQHANNSTLGRRHALVGCHLWHLLDEGALGGIELLEHSQGCLCGLLTSLGIGDGVSVGGLLLGTLGCGLRHGLGQLCLLSLQSLNLLAHCSDVLLHRLNACRELVDFGGLLLTLDLVVMELLIAPLLVLGLCSCLLLQLGHKILDHGNNLVEWVLLDLSCQGLEGGGCQHCGFLLQEGNHTRARGDTSTSASDLQQGCLLVEVDVLTIAASHLRICNDLDSFPNGLELGLAHLLVRCELIRLGSKSCFHLGKCLSSSAFSLRVEARSLLAR